MRRSRVRYSRGGRGAAPSLRAAWALVLAGCILIAGCGDGSAGGSFDREAAEQACPEGTQHTNLARLVNEEHVVVERWCAAPCSAHGSLDDDCEGLAANNSDRWPGFCQGGFSEGLQRKGVEGEYGFGFCFDFKLFEESPEMFPRVEDALQP